MLWMAEARFAAFSAMSSEATSIGVRIISRVSSLAIGILVLTKGKHLSAVMMVFLLCCSVMPPLDPPPGTKGVANINLLMLVSLS